MNTRRRSFVLWAVSLYLVMALSWIFLSDRLLTVFVDIDALLRLSTAKGVFFVLTSSLCFAAALLAVPGTSAPPQTSEEHLLDSLTHRRMRWVAYLMALVLPGAMIVVRLNILTTLDRPLLILFMLPMTLAALLGGFGPGIVATLTATIFSLYFFLPPAHSFAIASNADLFQLSILVVNGLVVSLISEAIRRMRWRELARRRQIEASNEALLQSEERFRRLFADAPVPLGFADDHGRIVAQNNRFLQNFGYSLEEVPTITQWWLSAYPDPEYRIQVQQSWEAALAKAPDLSETFDAGHYWITCKDGSRSLAHIFSIRMPDGLLTAFVDETVQYQAQEQLRLWAESFEQAQLGLILSDATTNTIISANPAFAKRRGFQREQIIGMPVQQLFPPDRQADAANLIATVNTHHHGLFESEHCTSDGQRFPVLIDVTMIRGRHGGPAHRMAYVLDITERKQAEQALAEALEQQRLGRIAALNQMQDANTARAVTEQAMAKLRESEERLSLFIEHAPAALAMFDRTMCYLAASRRWRDDYGLADTPLLGMSHYQIFPEIGDDWKEVHQRCLAGEVIRSDEDRFNRGDGRVQWLRWEVRPWHLDDGTIGGILIFSEDITRFKQAQEAIRQLNINLERRVTERTAELSAANHELDSFAYAVSHDLRAPLRAINGFAQALIEDFGTALEGEAKQYFDQIIIGSRKMGELIDGLLRLSRSTRGDLNRQVVDLSAMAERILTAMVKEESERTVQWDIEPGLIVHGDETMLAVVLQNLLDNAWKYSSHRPRAEIRVFGKRETAGQFCICIRDNGAGFDPAYANKLYQPFQRLHRQEEFPGIGIGLATVQRIIHRHGGSLHAEGGRDQGATFSFTLPENPSLTLS